MRKGEAWEWKLELWHQRYDAAGDAHILRAHPPVRQSGGKTWYEAKGPPDFYGAIRNRSVIFDAKEVRTERFPFDKLSGHQALVLERMSILGWFSFLAIKCSTGEYVVPWGNMRDLYGRWARDEEKAPASVLPSEVGILMGPDGWLKIVEDM